MAEHRMPVGALESEEERKRYWANLAPNVSNLHLDDFKTGLEANETMFLTVKELITERFEKHDLDSIATLPGGGDYKKAVNEATADLLTIFKKVPEAWMNVWCESLILDMWQENAAKKSEIREGKQAVPEDSPTTGKEVLRFSQQRFSQQPPTSPLEGPLPIPPNMNKQRRQPIDQLTFALHINSSDPKNPKQYPAEMLEIIAARCVPEGKDPKQVRNYQLDLFINEFEEIMNGGNRNRTYKMRNGQLVFYDGGSGEGAGKGPRRIILTQQQFEVAVSYLLNSTTGESLSFTFFQESIEETRQKLEAASKADKSARLMELNRIKQRQDNADALARREAVAAAKAEATKANTSTPPVPSRNTLRRVVPKRDAVRGPSVPSGSRAIPAPSQIPKPGRRPIQRKAPLADLTKSPTFSAPEVIENIPIYRKPGEQAPPPSPRPPQPETAHFNMDYPKTPPPLRRKKAIIKGIVAVHNAATRVSKTFSRRPSAVKEIIKPKVLPKQQPRVIPASEHTPRAEREDRARRPSNFQYKAPSPAIKRRSTGMSIVSTKASISLPFGIKNLFTPKDKNPVPAPPFNDHENLFEEIKRKTFRRGGQVDQEVTIGAAKVHRQEELNETVEGDEEIEEPDDADDFENPDEYLVSRLQGLQNMEELSQLRPSVDSEEWLECCRVFQSDVSKTGLDETVHLEGLRIALYQYQAFGVYWQMKKSREVGGGFVADEMGLGKTLSFLAYFVAERQLSWLWEDVATACSEHNKRHLNEFEQLPGARCPSRYDRPNWIACPCSPSSPTSKWPAKMGVRLACVPASLVNSWTQQWDLHVDERDLRLAMRLVIAHDVGNPVPAPSYDIRDGRAARNFKELGAVKHLFNSKLGTYHDDTARPRQDRYLVLTTRDSYKTWVKKFEYKGLVISHAKPDEPTWVHGKNRGIVFGIAMIDECHEEYLKEKGRSWVLSDLPFNNSPFIWGYSGTPLMSTPRSLEGVLWAIEHHFPKKRPQLKYSGWVQDKTLGSYNYSIFNGVCEEFEKLIKTRSGNPEVFRELEARIRPFLTTFMIRRTADSNWFGHPLIKLKTHIHQDVYLRTNMSFAVKLKELQDVTTDEASLRLRELQNTWKFDDPDYAACQLPMKLAFNTQCRVEWRLRIVVTFPFLLNLIPEDHKHHLDLTTEEVIKYKGTEVYKSPYSLYLRQIVESSPKCIWLRKFIHELDQTTDIDGMEQKLIIMTQFNPVALILKLFIERLIKDKKGRVGLVSAGMKARERTAVIDAFTGAVDKDSGIKKTKQNFQILIGTTRLIGTGLQLTRACNLVMMEPDYEFYRELQAIARIHRIGQKNPRSYSFRLIDQGSSIESRILKRQEERGEIFGKEVPTQLLKDFLQEKELAEMRENEVSKHKSLTSTNGSENARVQGEWQEIVDQFPVPPGGPSGTTGGTSRFIDHL